MKFLTSAQNGRGEYRADGRLEDRISLWTEEGQDRLLAQKTIAARGIMVRFYAQVKTYGKDAIQLADAASVTLTIPRRNYNTYSAGGPLISIGYANQVGAAAR